jgi:hypothetical protein
LQVETEDGFLLSVQHIPHGKNGVADNAGPPVFLQHGLFQVSLVAAVFFDIDLIIDYDHPDISGYCW